MGRPKKVIDTDALKKLAAIGCTYEEMADVMGCDKSTLTRRFAHIIKEGYSEGNKSLRRKQFEIAIGGNVGMLIWLGKQRLGQVERTELRLERIPDEILREEINRRLNGHTDTRTVPEVPK